MIGLLPRFSPASTNLLGDLVMYGSFSVKVNLRGGQRIHVWILQRKPPKDPREARHTLMKIPRADIAHRTPNQKSTVARAKAREPFRGPAQDANPTSYTRLYADVVSPEP